MKRRGFLQTLFGAPAAAVAGVAAAKMETNFPKGLVESEPEQVVASGTRVECVDVYSSFGVNYECMVSVVPSTMTLEDYARSVRFSRKELLG